MSDKEPSETEEQESINKKEKKDYVLTIKSINATKSR